MEDALFTRNYNEPYQWFSKKNVIIFGCIAVLATGLGIGVGYVSGSVFKGGSDVNYSGITEESLLDDNDALMVRYREVSSSNGDYLESFTPYEMVNIGTTLFKSQETYCTVSIGSTVAALGITQEILALHLRSGDVYFEESISSGLVNVYDRMWEEGGVTKTRWGSSKDFASMEEVSMSNEAYDEKMGRNVSDLSSYIISSKTVLTDTVYSEQGGTSVTKIDGGYQVELELDPVKAVINYVTQMQSISNLASKPSFSYCHLSYTLDEQLRLVSSTSYEKYVAATSSIIRSTCTGKLESKYQWGGEVNIPSTESTDSYYQNFDTFITGDITQ